MRILISDYSGHPFQVQLSRELARRGHDVLHLSSAAFQTPKGNLSIQPGDSSTFEVRAVTTRRPFQKASFFVRRRQEIEVGHLLAAECHRFRPDVVVSSNAPLDTQRILQHAARDEGARFVFWLQDIWSAAIANVVPRKFPVVGHLIADHYRRLEFAMLRKSDEVVAITEDFVPILLGLGVARDRIHVIENWAPLDELPQFPRDNEWATKHMAEGSLRIVYSGTLGYKHNPELLLRLAQRLPAAHVHVFSEGIVADELARRATAAQISNLSVKPWVPFADLPKMLSGADIFVAMIETEAGVYSVPSKILTYLAIGRPILAAVPAENLAALLIRREHAGYVASPDDNATMIGYAKSLAADATLRQQMGDNGRKYALSAFDVGRIADCFEPLIRQ